MGKHSAHVQVHGERFYIGTFGSTEAAQAAQAAEHERIRAGTSDFSRCAGTISLHELAKALLVPSGTLKRWCGEGMPSLRIGTVVRFDLNEATAWMNETHPNTIARARQAMVYVVQRDSDDAVKIGWTSDVVRRVKELRKNQDFQLVLLLTFPGDKPDELRLHKRFAADAIGLEWFRYSEAIAGWLARARKIAA